MVKTSDLGKYESTVAEALEQIERAKIVERIWACDHSVWKPEPAEITNRLGWLRVVVKMREHIPDLTTFAQEVCSEGFTDALLLGMGGSSLAPEVFRNAFGFRNGFLDLTVLDSTHPAAVTAQAQRLDPAKTLFVVSTKSGGTVETFSFFKYFYRKAADALGAERAGSHFIAITDPGSGLADSAGRYRFRRTFLNDPNIGGRYSALSYFGLVPASLAGIDLNRLLDRAAACISRCETQAGERPDSCAWLGAAIGTLAGRGRDKLTFILSPSIASFGAWVEQLIAESTGKEGKGIVPIDGEALLRARFYADDRVFIYLRLRGEGLQDSTLTEIRQAGHPVIQIDLDDVYDLGSEFFRWEFATALAGHVLQINPFDQPNVESSKAGARAMMAAYQKEGRLPAPEPAAVDGSISIYEPASIPAPDAGSALRSFLELAEHGGNNAEGRSYVVLQAYVAPSAETDRALRDLRTAILRHTRLATTVGYGPRFLHSTGQLHKGDAGHGLFIQLTDDNHPDAAIPDAAESPASSVSFGVLIASQAMGDRQALLDSGRRFIRFDLGSDPVAGLRRLAAALE